MRERERERKSECWKVDNDMETGGRRRWRKRRLYSDW